MAKYYDMIFRKDSRMNIAIIYILISVFAGALGQLLLKKGMSGMGVLTISRENLLTMAFRMGTNPFVVMGLSIYVMSTFFWLTALSRVDLSYAYPFISLSYVILLIGSWLLLDEHITALRLVGSGIVILGVILISRS
jgi:drug/metabolite transporter (DMT)-like permease